MKWYLLWPILRTPMVCPTHTVILIKLESLLFLGSILFSAVLKTRHLTTAGEKSKWKSFHLVGVIPSFVSKVENSCPLTLRQLALPVLCSFPSTEKT